MLFTGVPGGAWHGQVPSCASERRSNTMWQAAFESTYTSCKGRPFQQLHRALDLVDIGQVDNIDRQVHLSTTQQCFTRTAKSLGGLGAWEGRRRRAEQKKIVVDVICRLGGCGGSSTASHMLSLLFRCQICPSCCRSSGVAVKNCPLLACSSLSTREPLFGYWQPNT
jgi:hypothetical protein